MTRLAASIALAALVASAAGGTARAQTPAPSSAADPGSRAVALGREGIQLYEAGRWAEAEAKLAEAETVLHSPVFLLYIARCRRNAGRWLEARDSYRRSVAEEIAPSAPPAWRQALVDARVELSVLEPTIPSLVVRAPGASPTAAATIDGRPVALGEAIELDPGPHAITIADGERRASIAVTLASGERARVLDVPLATPGASSAPPPPPPRRDERSIATSAGGHDGSWVPGAVVLGIGVIGLGVGAATGLVALGESADVDEACPGGTCPAGVPPGTHDAQLADARTMADVATVSFIAGGVLSAAGVALLVIRPFGGDAVEVHAASRGVVVRGAF